VWGLKEAAAVVPVPVLLEVALKVALLRLRWSGQSRLRRAVARLFHLDRNGPSTTV